MSTLDLSPLRAHFPSLQLEVADQPAVFLDNPAGTQVPQQVIDAISNYYLHANANVGGGFLTSKRTDDTIRGAREAMADMLGAASPDEIVFGPNMTTLTFGLSRAIGRTLKAGDEILVTTLDHNANIDPWVALEQQGIVIKRADVNIPECTLNMDDLLSKIGERTKLVAIGYASNATGTINDIAPIIARAREVGALTFVDAVQYAPHGPIDVQALGCDFLACSAYKFFGPHIGILYGRYELLESLPAYKLRPAKDKAPNRWETGTQNHECLAGVTAAVDYLAMVGREYGSAVRAAFVSDANGSRNALVAAMQTAFLSTSGRRQEIVLGMAALQSYESELCQQLIAGLQQIPDLTIWGITEPSRMHERVPTVACTAKRIAPEALASQLGERGIFTWSGNYYALALMERLGLQERGGALRIGIAHYNTPAEVERLLETLEELV